MSSRSNHLHPRTIGWFGTTAVAMGGINQSLFLIGALFIGQGSISGQGSAAVVLLGIGLLLGWAATPGWTELILMYPNRVGGIAATCAEAFRPYSPVLANLTGVCYWWGWVPTCGLTALLASSAINQWYLPWFPVPLMASCIVAFFTFVNLCGVKWVMRLAMPIATLSASLAFISAVVPVFSGKVDWHQAMTFHLTVPFSGWFGQFTSIMAGLYLIGFAAPAFEQAACHVGETIDPKKNVPRAMFGSAAMATLYFIILPVVWLGALGPEALGQELAMVLGPTFAPLLGGAAKAAALWFMIFNMLHGTIAALAGASRTLSQLSEDGLLPEFLAKRSRTDAPWTATLLTAVMAIAFLLIGDPVWLIAAANLTYLIGIAMPNIAVWLLRQNEPNMERPYRAPRGTILLGVFAAAIWGLTAIFGFQQFGLPTVLIGIAFAYSGAALYAWRKYTDRRKAGLPGVARTLHLKLTGAMLLVLALDAAGYLMAVSQVSKQNPGLIVALEDIFVLVALLTISVGLILPGMIAHSAVEVAKAADKLVSGTLADFTRAMRALAAGDLEGAHAHFELEPVKVHSRDEVGDMASNFNHLQEEIGRAALGLEGARNGLSESRRALTQTNERLSLELSERIRAQAELRRAHNDLEMRVAERTIELRAEIAQRTEAQDALTELNTQIAEISRHAGMAEVATGVLHNVGNVLNSVNVSANVIGDTVRSSCLEGLTQVVNLIRAQNGSLAEFLTNDARGRLVPELLSRLVDDLRAESQALSAESSALSSHVGHIRDIVSMQQSLATVSGVSEKLTVSSLVESALKLTANSFERHRVEVIRQFSEVPLAIVDRHRAMQILVNLFRNAKQAMGENVGPLYLTIGITQASPDFVRITVTDNGSGIAPGNITRIFGHGFTTKKDGHGFGLHSSANAATEMGGLLSARSDGPGQGATFTLDLPIARPESNANPLTAHAA